MDDVTTPKKINIPLLVLIIVAVAAVVIIFMMRSSPDVTTPVDEPAPNPLAATNPDITKPQSPEQSSAPGANTDTTGIHSLPPSTK